MATEPTWNAWRGFQVLSIEMLDNNFTLLCRLHPVGGNRVGFKRTSSVHYIYFYFVLSIISSSVLSISRSLHLFLYLLLGICLFLCPYSGCLVPSLFFLYLFFLEFYNFWFFPSSFYPFLQGFFFCWFASGPVNTGNNSLTC